MQPTNRFFASDDLLFNVACKLAKTPATKRQASRWRSGKGKAYSFLNAARKVIQETPHLQLNDVLNGRLG